MSAWDRIVWIGSLVAPIAGWVALLAFAAVIVRPEMASLAGYGHAHAWVIGVLAVAWALGHVGVRLHSTLAPGLSRDDKSELRWKLNLGHGYAHWRGLMKRQGRGLYAGKSHSGERPRYD